MPSPTDWYVLQLSYKKLLGEVERLDRQDATKKPFNNNRRHMKESDEGFYNSGVDVSEYDSSTDEGYAYKGYGRSGDRKGVNKR